MLLSQAGLPYLEKRTLYSDLHTQPQKLGVILAEQRPLWPVGSGVGYHAISFGLYLDQIVRRVDPQKRSLAKYFREEIAIPFGKFVCNTGYIIKVLA